MGRQSKLEPRWLANVPMCGPRWAIALDAISSLLTRSSALESVLEVRPTTPDDAAAGSSYIVASPFCHQTVPLMLTRSLA